MEKDRTFNKFSVTAIALCLAMNLAGGWLALTFGLPLFFDAAGTVLCAALCGYLPAFIVGFCSNSIISLVDTTTLYFGIVSILFAAVTVPLAKCGIFKRLLTSFIALPPLVLVGTGLGSLTTWMLAGMSFGSGTTSALAIAISRNFFMGTFAAQITADFLLNTADKFITIIIVFVVIKAIPKKFLAELPLGWIYDGNPRRAIPEEFRTRKASLRTKSVEFTVISALILSISATVISFFTYENAMNAHYIHIGESAIALADDFIDGDDVQRYLSDGVLSESLERTEQSMYRIRAAIPDIIYMYVVRPEKDHARVILDLRPSKFPHVDKNGFVGLSEETHAALSALPKGGYGHRLHKGEGGHMLTVYKSVLNSKRDIVAYAAADISVKNLMVDRLLYFIKIASLLFGVLTLIMAFAFYYVQKIIVAPLNSLAAAAGKFAYESEEDRRKNMHMLSELNIHTGDEIENLYHAFSKTTSDMAEYVKIIKGKADIISKMQKNTIISFANMVENRDGNTGGHIRRTASYVRAIANAMGKMPKFSAVMTPDRIVKLVESVALHDIGKVAIPDAILNKPGRLTDEEFNVIKTHPAIGAKIMGEILSGIEEDNYLSEAIDMALCHHEKWDGTGYPRGLSGDQIPLSARIMAVADVFDALVSKRSYKEPFSLEKAEDIIREGSGTHFDPDVVTAFLSAKDEIEAIAKT